MLACVNSSLSLAEATQHTQSTSGQCPDRAAGTAPELRKLLEDLYPAMVMNIATDNVEGGNITVSDLLCAPCPGSRPPRDVHLLRDATVLCTLAGGAT